MWASVIMVNYFINVFLIHHIEKTAKPRALVMIKKDMHLVQLLKEGNCLHIHSIKGQPLFKQEKKKNCHAGPDLCRKRWGRFSFPAGSPTGEAHRGRSHGLRRGDDFS